MFVSKILKEGSFDLFNFVHVDVLVLKVASNLPDFLVQGSL
jgi:hypothetical protein